MGLKLANVFYTCYILMIRVDYGLLDLKRKKNSFLWGIKRIEGEDNLENLKKNYYYRNYLKLNFLPFYVIPN